MYSQILSYYAVSSHFILWFVFQLVQVQTASHIVVPSCLPVEMGCISVQVIMNRCNL
jgi:hypothetical protein